MNSETGVGFVGDMDEVRIYNRALSYSEIKALYDYESTPPNNSFITNGLVAYYPFNGNANDESGNGKNGSFVGGSKITDGALELDGVSGFVEVPGYVIQPGPFSVSLRIKPKISGDTFREFISQGVSGGKTYNNFYVGSAVGNKIRLSGGLNNDYYTTSSIDVNQWISISVVVDPVALVTKVFFDGKLVETFSGQSSLMDGKSGTFFRIGQQTRTPQGENYGSEFFPG
jgi:hypothetical protein